MEIKILGSGCAKCNELEGVTREAVAAAGVDANITLVSDFSEIMGYGIMTTPALVVDEVLKVAGRIPTVDEVKGFLGSAATGGCCGGGAAKAVGATGCGCGEGSSCC